MTREDFPTLGRPITAIRIVPGSSSTDARTGIRADDLIEHLPECLAPPSRRWATRGRRSRAPRIRPHPLRGARESTLFATRRNERPFSRRRRAISLSSGCSPVAGIDNEQNEVAFVERVHNLLEDPHLHRVRPFGDPPAGVDELEVPTRPVDPGHQAIPRDSG